jgi:transposase
MRQARQIIRLKFSADVASREIARRLGLAPSTVRETLKRVESAGLVWPLPNEMNDGALEAALYANRRSKRGHRLHSEPDCPSVHRELKRKHVTLLIVWDEYIAANPGGYSYSRFCELHRGFESKLSPTMRQTHAAGERLFVDYAGDGVPVVIDRLTGEIRMAHVDAGSHYYSVPYRFARTEVDVRLTAKTVEISLKGERIGAHMRNSGNRRHTTIPDHMASSHRRYAGWTIDRIREDARAIGPATAALCELILEHRPHPEQGFRACLGIVRLAAPYSAQRLEAAAELAIEIGALTYGSVKSILDNKLDRKSRPQRATDGTPILHANIRGPRYYN